MAQEMNVHSTGVTGYVVLSTTCRKITGTALVNHQAGYSYVVNACDNGEPGVNDTFAATLSNGYAVPDTVLGGGNIQLHEN